MDRLTIHPMTEESAVAMLTALSRFHAELVESADGWEIVVTFGRDGRDDAQIIAVLNALEQFLNDRADGPARVELNDRTYVMHPGGD